MNSICMTMIGDRVTESLAAVQGERQRLSEMNAVCKYRGERDCHKEV